YFNTQSIFLTRYIFIYLLILSIYVKYPAILLTIHFPSPQYLMKDREAFGLRMPLAYWNLCLSLFSAYGAFRTVPHLLNNIYQVGFEASMCTPAPESYGLSATGMATTFFVFSKFPELVDTVWIVLRKKPLIFLHWYHHITVLLFCWHAYATRSSAGLYFISMNYSVHAVMYFYYYAMAVKIWPKFLNPIMITMFQLSQMAVGIFVSIMGFYYRYNGTPCAVSDDNMAWGAAMYASYFYLFLEFLVKRYILTPSESVDTKKAAVDAKKAAVSKKEE
ncbi:hypothetical protein SARC_04992, partial [Sphaeroforma arctica JP610]